MAANMKYHLLTAIVLLGPRVCDKLRHVRRPKTVCLETHGSWQISHYKKKIQPGHKVSLQWGKKFYQTAVGQTNTMNE